MNKISWKMMKILTVKVYYLKIKIKWRDYLIYLIFIEENQMNLFPKFNLSLYIYIYINSPKGV